MPARSGGWRPRRGVKGARRCTPKRLGFGVWGLGFRVWGLGFRAWGLGFRVWGLGSRVWGFGGVFGGSGYEPVRIKMSSSDACRREFEIGSSSCR